MHLSLSASTLSLRLVILWWDFYVSNQVYDIHVSTWAGNIYAIFLMNQLWWSFQCIVFIPLWPPKVWLAFWLMITCLTWTVNAHQPIELTQVHLEKHVNSFVKEIWMWHKNWMKDNRCSEGWLLSPSTLYNTSNVVPNASAEATSFHQTPSIRLHPHIQVGVMAAWYDDATCVWLLDTKGCLATSASPNVSPTAWWDGEPTVAFQQDIP